MIKFFRNIRKNLITEGKTTKYFKYAIGEILLVVIGILIALQINNWNEERKDKKRLTVIYEQIRNDLQRDTLEMATVIKFLTSKNERLSDIIDRATPASYYDTINALNYKQCEKCRSDVTDFQDFQNQNKGYQLLKSTTTEPSYNTDSLSFKIDGFYTKYNRFVSKASSRLTEVTVSNINDYQKYEWFAPWSAFIGTEFYSEDFITYIFESEENRIKSANYLIFSRWYRGNLISYKDDAIQLLLQLEDQLNE